MRGTSPFLMGPTFVTRILFEKDPFRRAIQILVLTIPQGPEERSQSGTCHAQSDKDQPPHGTHQFLLGGPGLMAPVGMGGSLRALATTMIEDSDMATAATRGVT